MTKIPLGKVAFTDAGTYDEAKEFRRFDFISTDDSSYVSLQDNNVGHALTDTAWWKPLASGKAATDAAAEAEKQAAEAKKQAKAAQEQTSNCLKQTTTAETAAKNATDAARLAQTAKQEAQTAKAETESATRTAQEKTAQMESMMRTFSLETNAAPVKLEVAVPTSISTRNAAAQKIDAKLLPAYIGQNIIYQHGEGDSVRADPSGNLAVKGTGTTTYYVIPTQRTELWQRVSVKVRVPYLRLTAGGAMRLAGNRIRLA